MKKAISVVIIKNSRILLVRKKKIWILPGGKPRVGEADIPCLLREIQEELPQLVLRDYVYFDAFIGMTPHKGYRLRAAVYFANADGNIVPNAEINKAEWTKNPEKYNLSDITRSIVLSIRQNGHL